jgi:sulfotransferase family protein
VSAPAATEPVRVLYVAGWGRSGSTLLDRMLGELPGVFSAGELREIWQRGLLENAPCGCGAHFRECEFWGRVGMEAYGGWDQLECEELAGLRTTVDRPWFVPFLLGAPAPPSYRRRLARYLEFVGPLYAAIAKVSGANVVVDSSKLPSHAFLLRRLPGIDLRLVHLVRDSRAVAFSWQRQLLKWAAEGHSEYMHTYRPSAASARWLLYNGLTHLARPLGVPSHFLRYERLVREPREALGEVAAHAGLSLRNGSLEFVRDGKVAVGASHTVDGNPMRFSRGSLALRIDDEWASEMRTTHRLLVTGATLPLLLRYGYSLQGTAR